MGSVLAAGLSSHRPNLKEAIPFFEMACDMNVPKSCFHMGGAAMASAMKSVDSNEAKSYRMKALHAWTRGCTMDDELCCRNAALMYRKGDGIEADQSKVEEFEQKIRKLQALSREHQNEIEVHS